MNFQYVLNEHLTVTGEVKDMKQFIRGMDFLESLPKHCPLCGEPVRFFYRNPRDYDYYGLQCTGDIVHESNFGQRKDGGTLYYKGEWKEQYSEQDNKPKQSSENPPPPDDEDLPW